MPAESHLICLKPTCWGTAANVSLHVCVKGAEERDINRETGRAHRTTAYLIEKKSFVMLRWSLRWIDGGAYRLKLEIWSTEFLLLSPRLTHNNNEKSAGYRLWEEFYGAYPAHKRYMTWAAILSRTDSILHGVKPQSYCICQNVSVTQTKPQDVLGSIY